MTTPLTYAEFLAVFLGPPIVVLLALTWRRLSPSLLLGATIIGVVGVLYTTPWDNYLIERGVWWYGEGAVRARIYLAPVEEYAFMALQPVVTVLWVVLLRTRLTSARESDSDPIRSSGADTWLSLSARTRIGGVLTALLIGLGGVVMLLSDATFYMGAILAWASPVLALQWAFGWTHLWENRRLFALSVGVPTVYLAAADRIAIELGIWSLSAEYTTGLLVAGLPIEEGAFFLVTNVFVVQGILLYLWIVDPPTSVNYPASDHPTLNR
jgi:lycopene cyclase domain-containing protein